MVILQVIEGGADLMTKTGDAWAWALAGIMTLFALGTAMWATRKVADTTALVKDIYDKQQQRDDTKTAATHQAMSDTAKALQELAFGLRSVQEHLRDAIRPIADKIDLLNTDVRSLIRDLEKKSQ